MTILIKDNQLITGSKDHYIRVFELSSSFNLYNSYQSGHSNTDTNSSNNDVNNILLNGITVSKYNMMPPHYDGVQTLCRFNNFLFSGSRDMCIKKWSMSDHQCKQVKIFQYFFSN
jgi:kinesin family protein 4/21/27